VVRAGLQGLAHLAGGPAGVVDRPVDEGASGPLALEQALRVQPLGSGIRGQIVLGSVLSGLGAYAAVRFLVRYLRTRSLVPFGIYCLVAGLASVVYLSLAG